MGEGRFERLIALELAIVLVLAAGAVVGLRGCGSLRLARARARLADEAGASAPSSRAASAAAPAALPDLWGIAGKPSSRWSPDERARAEAIVAGAAAFLAALERGAVPATERDLVLSGKLLLTHGRLALLRGDPGTAVSIGRTLARLASTPALEPDGVRQRVILEAQQLALVQDLVAAKALSLEHVEAIRGSILATDLRSAFAREIARDWSAAPSVPLPASGDGWQSRVSRFLGRDLRAARVLERHIALAQQVRLPWRELQRQARQGARKDAPQLALLAHWAGRIAATESLRQFAGVATEMRRIGLRTGGYPAAIDALALAVVADPLTGDPVEYHRSAAGGALLIVPDGAQAWAEIALATYFETGPAVWKLPAPR